MSNSESSRSNAEKPPVRKQTGKRTRKGTVEEDCPICVYGTKEEASEYLESFKDTELGLGQWHRTRLTDHVIKEHKKLSDEFPGFYSCPFCHISPRGSNFKSHIQAHLRNYEYPCENCSRRFKSKKEKNEHELEHKTNSSGNNSAASQSSMPKKRSQDSENEDSKGSDSTSSSSSNSSGSMATPKKKKARIAGDECGADGVQQQNVAIPRQNLPLAPPTIGSSSSGPSKSK